MRPRRNPIKPKRVLFRDAKGRFLPETERYSPRVAMVQVKKREGYVIAAQGGRMTPKRLVDLLTREEFEALPEAYGEEKKVKRSQTKFAAWDIAGKICSTRGVRGKRLKIRLEFEDGPRKKHVDLYFTPKKNAKPGQRQTALWTAFVRQLGMDGYSEYDKIRSRFLEDRRGTTKVKLIGATIQETL